MINRYLFNRYYLQGHLVKALARCRSNRGPLSSDELDAYYRLGMYKSVADSICKDNEWHGAFAKTVSLAACGRNDEAAILVSKLMNRPVSRKQKVSLAHALAPFLPQLAFDLIRDCPGPVGLQAALLLRKGQFVQATEGLHKALSDKKFSQVLELNLLLSNAEQASPQQKLESLNKFLGSFSMSPVGLMNESMPPGPMNLRTATTNPQVHGPLVTVLMTAYQSGTRIGSAISSLLEQTYRNIEIVIVDDASIDDTIDTVQAWAKRDSRIIYIKLPHNVGTYVAKSIGLQRASGEFVTCHDSDDWAHPMRIERQVKPLIENHQLIFTTSHWLRMQDDGVYYARLLFPLMRLNPASPMFRRKPVLKYAGGWDPVRTGADSEFLARLTLVFGQQARHRLAHPLTIGAHRLDSLMTSTNTGYSAEGMSPTRLDYWENWNRYHIKSTRAWRKPYIPTDLLADRRFPAPESIVVSRNEIERSLL